MHAVVDVSRLCVLGRPWTLRASTFPCGASWRMLLLRGTSVVLLADEDHLLVLQVTLEDGLVPAGASRLRVGRNFRRLARVLHIGLVVVRPTPLRGLLLYYDIALRLQSLLLDEVGLVLQYLLCFLLMDAGPSVGGLLVGAVREVTRTASSASDLRIRREDGAAAAAGLSLLPHELMLLVVAAVALATSVMEVVTFRLHPVLVAGCGRIHRRHPLALRGGRAQRLLGVGQGAADFLASSSAVAARWLAFVDV